jgi:hypothetical protein
LACSCQFVSGSAFIPNAAASRQRPGIEMRTGCGTATLGGQYCSWVPRYQRAANNWLTRRLYFGQHVMEIRHAEPLNSDRPKSFSRYETRDRGDTSPHVGAGTVKARKVSPSANQPFTRTGRGLPSDCPGVGRPLSGFGNPASFPPCRTAAGLKIYPHEPGAELVLVFAAFRKFRSSGNR